ncbi:MAG: diaminopimelate epimerase [Dehalococcoidales bacterium]|nr:diaminopimelate epimerase [Dehalococcoidales bacterium]
MKFTKMQGAGNDFVVIDSEQNRRDWSKLAVKMCDRHYGIGADGLLVASPSKVADFKMRIFNADGSESTVCGNGLRCLVKHYIDGNRHRNDSEIAVETSAGIRTARIHRRKEKDTEILANMGEPKVGHNGNPAKTVYHKNEVDIKSVLNCSIKVDGKDLLLSLVSMGNPHAIHFCNGTVDDFPLAYLGPKIEQHKLFQDETNFEIVNVIDRKRVVARVWERGVGETLACGSGACAITVAGNLLGYLDKKVHVHLPGGVLIVEWDTVGDVFLSGPAITVFTGEW